VTPAMAGLGVYPAREQALAASQGVTDFGEYFTYFSFFLVASALMLTVLFFRLGIEQRLIEIGVLRATGFPPATIRRMFLLEGAALAIAGSLAGIAGALGYAGLVMVGLRTWWVDAVGTTLLRLHVAPGPLALGALGGVTAALVCIAWTVFTCIGCLKPNTTSPACRSCSCWPAAR
jgi:putative ABC transport system permease protein